MKAARVTAGRIAMAGPRFEREGTTRARALPVDATTGIDAKSPPQRKAASRAILGAAHTHPAVIERLRECNGHPAARLRIEFVTEE